MKSIKGYHINAENRTVTEVEVKGDYKTIYPFLGESVDCFTCVGIEKDDTIYVDDEGLLKPLTALFLYEGYDQPLAGNGLILGTDAEGESVSPANTLEFIKSKVKFMTPMEARLWAMEHDA